MALDEQGRANFQELQNRRSTRFPIVYYVLDVLHANGSENPLQVREAVVTPVLSNGAETITISQLCSCALYERTGASLPRLPGS